MTTSALVVIDLQRDLCLDERRRRTVAAALPDVHALIDGFAEAGRLVVYTRFALRPDDPQFARFGDTFCIEGTPGAEFIDEVLPLRGPTVTKRRASVFFETALHDLLQERGVDRLFFAGLQTQICIQTSMADASFRGYDAVAVRECVLSTRQEKKDYSLEWIAAYVGSVAGLPEALDAVRRETAPSTPSVTPPRERS